MLTRGGSGLLVCANNDRKLDVKVGIRVVQIISNCVDQQGSIPLDMQEINCIIYCLKSKPFSLEIKILCMQKVFFEHVHISFCNLTNAVPIL